MTTTYTLTPDEARRYDSTDARISDDLTRELVRRFGPVDPAGAIAVEHPDGFVVNVHTGTLTPERFGHPNS